MKPHIRKVRGIWTVRMCIRVHGRLHGPLGGPIGHGYTVREACEDWKAQMKTAPAGSGQEAGTT